MGNPTGSALKRVDPENRAFFVPLPKKGIGGRMTGNKVEPRLIEVLVQNFQHRFLIGDFFMSQLISYGDQSLKDRRPSKAHDTGNNSYGDDLFVHL
jgi:hypothetical protein